MSLDRMLSFEDGINRIHHRYIYHKLQEANTDWNLTHTGLFTDSK